MKTTLILVRHGQTAWNKLGKVQGQTDIPLSPEGMQEAKLLAKQIRLFAITRVVTSTLSRAIQTAEITAESLRIPRDQYKDLNERNYGALEGAHWKEADKHLGFGAKPNLETSHLDAESFTDFKKRVVNVTNHIIDTHAGETILIVCHGGVLQVLARHFHNILDTEEALFHFPNTSVSIYEIENNLVTIKLVGDTKHLE